MYDFLKGQVAHLDIHGRLTVEVNGIGYSLRVSEQTRQALPLDGSTATIWTRLVVREDDLLLFGFADIAERAAFDLLTTVQGVGPTVALAVLSAYGVGELRQLLLRKDAAALRKVKGVGAKSAERIALELHDKVEHIPAPYADMGEAERGEGPAEGPADEARRALVALGFANREAIDAIARVHEPAMPADAILRAALGVLR